MNQFELLTILPGTLTEDEVRAVNSTVTSMIKEKGAQTVESEEMGKRRLAYPMKKIRYGYYQSFIFDLPREVVAELQKRLLLLPEVLRFMIQGFSPEKRAAKRQWQERRASSAIHTGGDGTRAMADKTEAGVSPSESFARASESASLEQTAKKEERGHVDMKEIDKKLDEILDSSLTDV